MECLRTLALVEFVVCEKKSGAFWGSSAVFYELFKKRKNVTFGNNV